jgi:aspartate carbamoyltransferase catalytic subunit
MDTKQLLKGIIDQRDIVMIRRVQARKAVSEKFAKGYSLRSSDYDALIETDAQAEVWSELARIVEHDQAVAEQSNEEILDYIQRNVIRRAASFRGARSTSAADNLSETAQHIAWLEALRLVQR